MRRMVRNDFKIMKKCVKIAILLIMMLIMITVEYKWKTRLAEVEALSEDALVSTPAETPEGQHDA